MDIFLTLFKGSIKTQLEYRFNFIFDIIISMLTMLSEFMVIWLIMLNFKSIGGWSIGEIAIIYSVIEFGWGFFRFLGEGIHRFQDLIITGKFDAFLLRPVSSLYQMMFQKIEFKRLGIVIQSIIVGIYGISMTQNLRPNFLFYYCFILILSVIITFEINVILAATAFWTIKNDDLIVLAFYAMRTAAEYPKNIYGNFLGFLVTFIIPLACIGYYPVSWLTYKNDNVICIFLPLIVALIFCFLSMGIWKLGVKKYTGTGT